MKGQETTMKNIEKIEELKTLLRGRDGLWECMEILDDGDTFNSIECFDNFIKNNPDDIDGHIGKALAIYEAGKWEDAIKALTEGLKLDPTYELGLLIRAEMLRANGKEEFALKFYDKLLSISPSNENYLANRAEVLKELGQDDDPTDEIAKVEEIGEAVEKVVEEPEPTHELESEPVPEDTGDWDSGAIGGDPSEDILAEENEESPAEAPIEESPASDDNDPLTEKVMMFRGIKVTKSSEPAFEAVEEEETLKVTKTEAQSTTRKSLPHDKCPKCGFMKAEEEACPFCSIDDDLAAIEGGEISTEAHTGELDDLDDLDLEELEKLSATDDIIKDSLHFEEDLDELEEMVCESCGDMLDPSSEYCNSCGEVHDKVMFLRGTRVSKVSTDDRPILNNYEEDRWSSFVDKARTEKNRSVNIIGVFSIISIAIYLIFLSMIELYDSLFVEFNSISFFPNVIIFLLGFGALYGGVNIAKNSIVFDHFLDSVFETEVYPRLEPALEEVAQVQARLENIEERMDRMNMNIARYKEYPSAAEFPAVAITNRITSFLKIVVATNITIGILMYAILYPGEYVPYLFTIMFMLWWGVITDDYKLWKNAISWAWAIIPIFAVPFMSIFLFVVIPIGSLIGLVGGFLIIYVYAYFAWVRYYVEGKLPFDIYEAQLEEEE